MASSSSYPTIDADTDRLIEDDASSRRRWSNCFGQKRLSIFLVSLLLIVIGHVLAIYFIYFKCSSHNCQALKIVALNTWGMPATLGSEFKEERIKAIGDRISKGDYDVFLLEELWMNPDHDTIASRVPGE